MNLPENNTYSRLKFIKRALKKHYEQPLELAFKQFRDGAIYFAVGLITIYISHSIMQASIMQEIVFLLALLLTGFGFIKAMLAQLRLIIGRLYRFYKK